MTTVRISAIFEADMRQSQPYRFCLRTPNRAWVEKAPTPREAEEKREAAIKRYKDAGHDVIVADGSLA